VVIPSATAHPRHWKKTLVKELFCLLQVMAAEGGGKDGVEIQTARIVKYPTQRARLHTLRTSTPLDPAARQAAAANKSAGGPRDAAAAASVPFGDRQSQFQTALMEAVDRSALLFPSVADPECLSRIRIFSNPDPGSRSKRNPGSALKKLSIFNPKNCF
jgi:hypothetical protein